MPRPKPWDPPWVTPDSCNLDAVVNALKSDQQDRVVLHCFNRDEAKYVWDRLTMDERARTSFTWSFGERPPLDQ